MSIVKKDFFNLKCDICGALYDDEYWDDEAAFDWAEENCWLRNYDGKDICPDCYEIDDEDNITLKQK